MPYYARRNNYRSNYRSNYNNRPYRRRYNDRYRRRHAMYRNVGRYNKKRNFYYTAVLTHNMSEESNLWQAQDDSFGSLRFRMTDVPNFAKFTSIFDFYRIKSITVTFRPMRDMPIIFDPPTPDMEFTDAQPYAARLYSIIDKNDTVQPASIDDITGDSSLFITDAVTTHVRKFVPRAITGVYSDGDPSPIITPGSESSPNQWFRTTNLEVFFYGMKMAVCGHGVPSIGGLEVYGQQWSTEVRYVVEFKDPT